MNERYNIPVALIIFRRTNTLERIVQRIREVQPSKFYILSDGGRTAEEEKEVENCRNFLHTLIDWDCEVIDHFAENNIGVYENIAGGAKWVLEREPWCIFLEDDNLPEVSFFYYCKEMLERYKENERVFWICGTNYLEKYETPDGSSYMFTQHCLPCGWASWSDKFVKYYDGDLKLLNDQQALKKMASTYQSKALYRQQLDAAKMEKYNMEHKGKYASWDFQMAFSIRAQDLLGIVPVVNQIENIGVDIYSTHNGSSFSNPMIVRFCGIKSYHLKMPLKHPETVKIDEEYEHLIDKIVLHPWNMRVRKYIARFIKRLLGRSVYESLK